jgi:RecJ-like exonuclease
MKCVRCQKKDCLPEEFLCNICLKKRKILDRKHAKQMKDLQKLELILGDEIYNWAWDKIETEWYGNRIEFYEHSWGKIRKKEKWK